MAYRSHILGAAGHHRPEPGGGQRGGAAEPAQRLRCRPRLAALGRRGPGAAAVGRAERARVPCARAGSAAAGAHEGEPSRAPGAAGGVYVADQPRARLPGSGPSCS